MRKNLLICLLTAGFVSAAMQPALAEDVKGKWYFGGDFGALVTTDNVRSNAALIIAPLGNDGAPFTGDKGEIVSCSTTQTNVFCDPRPDDLISRQMGLEQTVRFAGTIGYGLTSNISVQLDVGYYKGDLTNVDVFTRKNVPMGGNPLDPCVKAGNSPCNLNFIQMVENKSPFSAAEITEMPVTLSAIYRFRTDSNFNPYIGAGAGMLVADASAYPEVNELNERLETLHLTAVTDEFGPSYGTLFSVDGDGNAPFFQPAEVEISDGFIWQFVGGGEYFFNDRFSVTFDAKYILANHQVSLLFGGEDQLNLQGFTEDIFRPDGSLRVFLNGTSLPPNPVIDPNNPFMRYDCDADNDGQVTDDFGRDYDGDGLHRDPVSGLMIEADACFIPAPGVRGQPVQTIVAQGGSIDLTHFSFGVGLRIHF